MKFPPIYSENEQTKKLLYDLDVLRTSYSLHPIPKDLEVVLQRKTLLKSSLSSAKIEGNSLDISELTDSIRDESNSHDIQILEVSNLVQAYEILPSIVGSPFGLDTIKQLHAIAMNHISADAGYFRTESSAIFNQAGIAVYITPSPQSIGSLLEQLCEYIASSKDSAPVIAAFAHIWFEKIHPFTDGNGRVGRLVSALLLQKHRFSFGGIVPFEEYLESHRDDYYYALGRDRQDVTLFVEFFLNALVDQATASMKMVFSPQEADPYAHLLPRRAEIMRIINDHKVVTFDFLARRFRAVPKRTLHYDITQLIAAGLIQKMGSTRGVSYTLK